MNKYFESLDGISIVPFSKVVKVSKFDTDKKTIAVYYPSPFLNNIHCSYDQLIDYLYWLNNKDSVKG